MSSTPNKSYFSNLQMRNALLQIEDQMVHSNWMPDLIMGINRGGCIPGVYLSHRLKKEHLVLDIRLRDHKATPDLSVLTKQYAFQRKILIIDDINDTGATFKYIQENFYNKFISIFVGSIYYWKYTNSIPTKLRLF